MISVYAKHSAQRTLAQCCVLILQQKRCLPSTRENVHRPIFYQNDNYDFYEKAGCCLFGWVFYHDIMKKKNNLESRQVFTGEDCSYDDTPVLLMDQERISAVCVEVSAYINSFCF